MNRNEFNRFIAGIDLPGPGDLDELRELTSLFPWFHSAHMLLLRGLKENNDIRFDSQLRVSALSVADREVLYHYLFLSPADVAGAEVVTTPAFTEVPCEEVPPVVITATGETPVAEEVPDTEEIPVISADQPAEGTPVAEEVPGTEEVPGSEEVIVTEEVPVTGETPVIFADQSEEEIPGPEEISVAGEESAGNVIDGAEDRQAEELTEKLRTREELIAEIEARLRELEEIHKTAADQVAQQVPEQQIPVAGQMPEEMPATVLQPEELPVTEPVMEEVLMPESMPVEIPVHDLPPERMPESELSTEETPVTESAPEELPAPEPEPEEIPQEFPEQFPEEFPEPVTEPLPEPVPGIEIEWQTGTPAESESDAEPRQEELLELIPDQPEEESEPATQLTPADLIDRFIRISPSIERLTPGDVQPVKDLSAESTDEHGKFITETLAKIYINQGYYSRAINIYERLSLQYPEKSAYFASRIEKIKDLIK